MIEEDKLNALELFGENEYLHKEIERLNKELDYYKREKELYRYYQQEVPRLSNIIDNALKIIYGDFGRNMERNIKELLIECLKGSEQK